MGVFVFAKFWLECKFAIRRKLDDVVGGLVTITAQMLLFTKLIVTFVVRYLCCGYSN